MRRRDPKITSTFEVLGSYFVGVFYNDLYIKASTAALAGTANTVTDAYKNIIIKYQYALKTHVQLYTKAVETAHEYYRIHSRYATITLRDFEDTVVSRFVPTEYFRDLSDRRKDSIMHHIIVKTVTDFSSAILQPATLHKIIDDHANKLNIRMLQDKIVEILFTLHDDYFARFAREHMQAGDNVHRSVLDNLRKELATECAKREKLEADMKIATSIITRLLESINELRATCATHDTATPTVVEPTPYPRRQPARYSTHSEEPLKNLVEDETPKDLVEDETPESEPLPTLITVPSPNDPVFMPMHIEDDPGFGS